MKKKKSVIHEENDGSWKKDQNDLHERWKRQQCQKRQLITTTGKRQQLENGIHVKG